MCHLGSLRQFFNIEDHFGPLWACVSSFFFFFFFFFGGGAILGNFGQFLAVSSHFVLSCINLAVLAIFLVPVGTFWPFFLKILGSFQ